MAESDQLPKPFSPPAPSPPPALPPPPPFQPRPVTPPAGIPVKETNLSNLSPSPAPHIPTPPPPPPPTPLKSSIRTMEGDLNTLKQPQAPRPTPPPPPPPSSLSQNRFPAAPAPSIVRPSSGAVKPSPLPVSIPTENSGSGKKWLVIAIIVILIIGGLTAWFFATRGSAPAPSPTPTETPIETPIVTPTPVLLDFQGIFHPEPVTSTASLDIFVKSQKLAVGELRTYNLQKSFSQFITDQKLHVPADIVTAVDASDFSLLLFGKPDATNSRGFAVKVVDASKAQSALTAWEATMSIDLKTLLKITPLRAASKTFLGSTYQGIPVRYRNFPDALMTIDYAVVTMPRGDIYLMIANSRDQMFAIIDHALSSVPGK